MSFTINKVSQQHVSIRLHQNHLRPNQRKLARHDKINKQHSKKNKPIEFRHCRLYSLLSSQLLLLS